MTIRDRLVQEEILDHLPGDDPEAVVSRSDLRLLNRIMRHANPMARLIRSEINGRDEISVVDIGCGDGTFSEQWVTRIHEDRVRKSLIFIDRIHCLSSRVGETLQSAGWRYEVKIGNAESLLLEMEPSPDRIVIANLFLHHFEEDDLRSLLESVSSRASAFICIEPRRSRFSLGSSRLIGALGCNRVTRHDAVVSVRAGFRGREISLLWPESKDWMTIEKPVGLFSHLFYARKNVASARSE